ncbi:nitrate- and nitrite sensing domain-containing protein [Streptomyces sp. NPDC021098]|uniref:nitrate- and nitrite sensing domain-containing protein n=1 Tax=unclassified Streptomyces TaxID=2593676 RepID=UPI0037AF520F
MKRVGVKSETAMVALQEERRLSMDYVAQSGSDRGTLDRQRAGTDRKLAAMRESAAPVVAHNPPDLKRIFGKISKRVGEFLAAAPRQAPAAAPS